MSLTIRLHPDAERKLERLARRRPGDYIRLSRALRRFSETGRGLQAVHPPLFRLRVGDWRVFIGLKGEEALVVDILWRDVAYRLEIIERLLKRVRLV